MIKQAMIFVWAVCAASVFGTSERGLLAEGTKWESSWFVVDSGKPGPTVMILGGLHGNEYAGPRAAGQIRTWEPTKGKLVIAPRVNIPGWKARERELPGEPEGLDDLNRNFPLPGKENVARGEPAKAIWAWVQRVKPDYLLDLHEGYGFRAGGSKSVGSSVIRVPHPETKALQDLMVDAVNAGIRESNRVFVALHGAAKGSLARACGERLGSRAFILETTKADQDLALRVRQHRIMVHALLKHLGMIEHGRNRLVVNRVDRFEVAIYDGAGAGSPVFFENLIEKDLGASAHPVHPADIREGVLSQFDVVVFPGGSGSKQAGGLHEQGRDAVRGFVKQGGGYVGVCAGAYLATSHYKWSLGIINAASLDTKHWRRGMGEVAIELSEPGQKVFTRPDEKDLVVYFAQGPILGPGKKDDLPPYETLAWYRSGLGKNGADSKTMEDKPAMIRSRFGKGGVFLFSPHPEKTEGLKDFIGRAVEWTVSD